MHHIHFIGVGGVGMNGLAQLAIHAGYTVSGSDRAYSSNETVFASLEHLGVQLVPQDGSGISSSTTQVVYSTAIESSNPDLQAAKALGIPLLHRATFLKQLVGNNRLIAIAGTAGKTTTTGLVGWILAELGLDPSVYNGAAVANWKTTTQLGNARAGSSDLWVIEADESDKSLLQFHPTHTLITNISKDHYELDELHAMFDQFEKQTSGTTIQGSSLPLNLLYNAQNSPIGFTFNGIEFIVSMLGLHNLENARGAIQLCHELGLDLHQVREALARFKGIERRLEICGSVQGITVIDDYAHNPAKIAAALSAVAHHYKQAHAYWRPHGFTPLSQGFDDFLDIFTAHLKKHGGSLYILPVYYAGGTVQRSISSEDLVQALNQRGVAVQYAPTYDYLQQQLEEHAEAGDAILGMGARDPELPKFAQKLVTQWKTT